ncbi:hypothetical protein B0H13DRAFT_254331 [Mycena leptocephala]|nr:hypothetical protein B0H13DRAFT_254331 [Mycena leptocephala]
MVWTVFALRHGSQRFFALQLWLGVWCNGEGLRTPVSRGAVGEEGDFRRTFIVAERYDTCGASPNDRRLGIPLLAAYMRRWLCGGEEDALFSTSRLPSSDLFYPAISRPLRSQTLPSSLSDLWLPPCPTSMISLPSPSTTTTHRSRRYPSSEPTGRALSPSTMEARTAGARSDPPRLLIFSTIYM